MYLLLPFFYTVTGFCFAFLGNTFSKEINHLPITQIITELVTYVQFMTGLSTNQNLSMSFHINEILMPGFVYACALFSFFMACLVLYNQIEVEKLEESLLKMVMMSLLVFVCAFVFISGGKLLVIVTGTLIVCINFIVIVLSFVTRLFRTNYV